MPSLVTPVVTPGRRSASAQPTLPAAGGLVLSRWEPADFPALLALYSDPAVQHYHGYRFDSEGEARQMIERWSAGWTAETSAHWKVTRGRGGDVVGRVGLLSITGWNGQAECLYSTMPAARGQGIAPLALAALCDWAFGPAGLHRIELRHSMANSASCRVAEKSGFPAEGIQRGAEPHDDGWHDLHLHARLASD
jgi:ribosomal-protein-alanine N-acetyltransferase